MPFFCSRRRGQHTDGEVAHSARQLRSAEDGGIPWHGGKTAVGDSRITTRVSADATRVEDVAIPALELIRARAFDEEGTLLVEERLERAQIDDGGIGFDLSEIRVDGGVERQRRSDGVLEIGTDRRTGVGSLLHWVAGLTRLGQYLRDGIGHELEPLRQRADIDAVQPAERRYPSTRILGEQRPGRGLVEPRDIAPNGKPDLAIAFAAE